MFIPNVNNEFIEIENTIKTLLFQKTPDLVKELDFENSKCFSEPLLFILLQQSLIDKNKVSQYLQGFKFKQKPIVVDTLLNRENIAYLPNLGYYSSKPSKIHEIQFLQNSNIELLINKNDDLLKVFNISASENERQNLVEISKQLILKYRRALENSISILKNCCTEHFSLIEKCCKKIVLFKTDPQNTNSFATINAHGIAFFNVYQDDYDEVFFIDDIAHQTGHIILNTLLFNREKYFKVDVNQSVAEIIKDPKEYRDIFTLYHALYTYYTSINCLQNAIEENLLSPKQEKEALGRIGFYLLKYKSDINKIEKIAESFGGSKNVFKDQNLMLYDKILKYYYSLDSKEKYDSYNFSNQPYNYTHKNFLEVNES